MQRDNDEQERRKYMFKAGASYTGECLPALFSNELLSYVKYCINPYSPFNSDRKTILPILDIIQNWRCSSFFQIIFILILHFLIFLYSAQLL